MHLQASCSGRVQAAPSFLGAPLRAPAARQCRRRMSSVTSCTIAPDAQQQVLQRPDKSGRYGKFGGKYVPGEAPDVERAGEGGAGPPGGVGGPWLACGGATCGRINPGGPCSAETLISALAELEEAYEEAKNDPAFKVWAVG